MSVKTSGPVFSSKKPSLVQLTPLTGPPDELQVRVKVISTDPWTDVSWNVLVSGATIATTRVKVTTIYIGSLRAIY